MVAETKKKWALPAVKLPRGVIVAICALPAVITGLFYALRSFAGAMDWAVTYISAPVRGFFGMLSSVYPFSVTEVLLTVAVVWLIYYIVKTVMVTVRRRGKMKILGRRLLPVVVAALYAWGLFCWLWLCGYHAPGFARNNGFEGGGVAVGELTAVARLFAKKANELAPLMDRNEDGRYVGDRRGMFAASTGAYYWLTDEFPSLDGRLYTPKSMLFSWLMSRTGYTGMYFALTGEVNINIRMPVALMPATVAHEHAHQLGVFSEDEANFVGIAACVTSRITVFEYSGYLKGLMHLMSALHGKDYESWSEISAGLCDEVLTDWRENYDYWESQRKVETGVGFLDNILTGITVTVSDGVDSLYDGFLKSQNQELGLESYGACVDLLVEYFARELR